MEKIAERKIEQKLSDKVSMTAKEEAIESVLTGNSDSKAAEKKEIADMIDD
jgi:hypothetical protein